MAPNIMWRRTEYDPDAARAYRQRKATEKRERAAADAKLRETAERLAKTSWRSETTGELLAWDADAWFNNDDVIGAFDGVPVGGSACIYEYGYVRVS